MTKSPLNTLVPKIQEVSKDRLAGFAKVPGSSIQWDKKVTDGDQAFYPWTSKIAIKSNDLDLDFIVYFSTETIQELLSDEVNIRKESFYVSFASEYCNIVGGAINKLLDNVEIRSTADLPESRNLTEEKNEFREDIPFNDHVGNHWWRIKINDKYLICNCIVQYHKELENLDFGELDSPDEIMEVF